MEMTSVNLSFCSFVSIRERLSFSPHPDNPDSSTIMRQETEVTVMGVPLANCMEGLIVDTISRNAGKSRTAINWVVEKLSLETRNLSSHLDKLKGEIVSLTDSVAENLIVTAKKSIEELQRIHPPMLQAQELTQPLINSSAKL
jgi:hypothetical protein